MATSSRDAGVRGRADHGGRDRGPDDPEPVVTPARLCLDTGAYHSGRLTAARLDDETTLIAADVFEP